MQRLDFELQESLASETVGHLLQGLVIGALEWAGGESVEVLVCEDARTVGCQCFANGLSMRMPETAA